MASKPPFVVGSNCAIFGTPCGGGHPSYRFVAPLHTVAALRFPAPSGPPIAPLPRNRLAFSAAGGASPLSSSPQNPLRWAFVGCPFPWKKRMRLLMVSREKTLAAAFRASPGTLAAPDTGGWPDGSLRALPTQSHMSMKKLGAFPDALSFSFRCRTLAFAEAFPPTLSVFRNHRTAAAKQEQGASGTSPGFCNRHTRLSGRKPSSQYPNTPRKRREKAFRAKPGMPPPASFLLTPSKSAFSFRRNR